jgi:anaerobic ribonucleoside-triphosphate reductase activating protein
MQDYEGIGERQWSASERNWEDVHENDRTPTDLYDDIDVHMFGIADGSTVDGKGMRTVFFFQGCSKHCKGCQNPDSWDLYASRIMTVRQLLEKVRDGYSGITLSGGDPLEQPVSVVALAEAYRRHSAEKGLVGKTVWLWTGWTIEQIDSMCGDGGICSSKSDLAKAVRSLDVMVDGPFILSQKSLSTQWRGSSNQRVIDIPATLLKSRETGKLSVVVLEG